MLKIRGLLFDWILLAFIGLVLAGCAKEKETGTEAGKMAEQFLRPAIEKVTGGDWKGDKAGLKDLIVRYNEGVIQAQIHSESVMGLKELTTKREFTRMRASVEQDRAEGKIMSCTLRSLKFIDATMGEEEGVVKTTEEWFFEDRDLKTGAILVPFRDFEYEVEYKVVKEDGKLLIDGIELKRAQQFMPPRGEPRRLNIKIAEVEK